MNNLKHVKIFFLLMFALVALFFIKTAAADAGTIKTNSYNRRLNQAADSNVKRGSVLDRNGVVLAESVLDGGVYVRKYPFGSAFSHMVGYSVLGKSGVEKKYNFELQTLNGELSQRFNNVLNGSELVCNDVKLTLDSELQKKADSLLGNRTGSVVILEPSSGKILAMCSNPDFNPATVDEKWAELSSDVKSSLLNRASQGLYPPGSIFKVITAYAALEADMAPDSFECAGEIEIAGTVIHCSGGKAHGAVDMKSAFAQSCNAYFAALGKALGSDRLKAAAAAFGIGRPLSFPLEYSVSSFPLKPDAESAELLLTAIGQGNTLVTPLQAALIASAAANGGIVMKPYLLDSVLTPGGKQISKTVPELLTALDSRICLELAELMTEVVASGTGRDAKLKSVSVAGKTGTAQNSSGKDHSWFIAFAPAESPEIAVCVMLESIGGGNRAMLIAKELLNEFFAD